MDWNAFIGLLSTLDVDGLSGPWTIETKTTPITEQISIPSNYGPFKDIWSGIIPVPAEQRQEIRQEAWEGFGGGGGARTKPFTGQGSSMPADTVTLIRSETQKLATFFAVRSSLVAKSWMSAAEGCSWPRLASFFYVH